MTRLPLDWIDRNRDTILRFGEQCRAREAEKKRVYVRNRRRTDDAFRILGTLRQRLRWVMLNGGRIENLIGCSAAELREHMQAQFRNGMTWENYGHWEIDHVIPCARFDMTIPAERLACFHYTNLRPMRAADNRLKRAR